MAILWFANLDVRKLQHPDEGRYAEIAREMVVSGDWVTPRLNGLKYFEKPPLQYWLTAAGFEAFGIEEWTARLPGALAGLLTIVCVGYAASMLASATTGAYAALALAGMVWPFGIAHVVTLDALLTFWLTGALCAFLLAQHWRAFPKQQQRWMLLAWAATAGGVLTKGLVALVIPSATLVIHALLTRDLAPWRQLHPVKGIAVLMLLAAPWFVLVSSRNPEFARFFFIHEHFQRFLTTEHRRTGAWWYFLPMVAAGLLPWTGVFLWRVRAAWTTPADGPFAWVKFCLIWCAFVLVFFSLSGSKLPSYILPIFPAAALVLGRELERIPQRTLMNFAALAVVLTAVLWLASVTGWPRVADSFSDDRTPRALLDALGRWVAIALGIATIGYAAGFAAFRRRTTRGRTVGIATFSLATMAMMQVIYFGSDVFRATRSAADLVATLERASDPPYDPRAPFFQVRMYDQTLPFYLRRTTTLVAYRDEMALGLDAEPQLGIAAEPAWVEQWRALPQGYALMAPETLRAYAAAGVPMRVVATDTRRVLVARR